MAIFGRWSARQRMRSAAREALAIPAFSAPIDCSAWVLGGLWPAELTTVTPETAPLADYLNADLQRIASSANEKLHAISRSGLAGQARQAAEARVINVARAFAVLRVESTVRQLHQEPLELGTEHTGINAAPVATEPAEQTPTDSAPTRPAERSGQGTDQRPRAPRHRLPEPLDVELSALFENLAAPEVPPPAPEVAEALEVPPGEPAAVPPVEMPATAPAIAEWLSWPSLEPAPSIPAQSAVAESEDQRLQRLLAFVARQEPGLRWAIGTVADGSTLLVTDIADGWIPSGIELPAGVRLLEPGRRTGTASEMLGTPTGSACYTPGDRLGWSSDFGATDTSVQPRELAFTEDLGWQLSEATHGREGLPRIASTLAKAGSAGTGVVDAEVDLLRVHLDTLRYQLLAQYPDSEAGLALNCMLLAATEGIASGDLVSANYHYRWFRTLSAPHDTQWGPQT